MVHDVALRCDRTQHMGSLASILHGGLPVPKNNSVYGLLLPLPIYTHLCTWKNRSARS